MGDWFEKVARRTQGVTVYIQLERVQDNIAGQVCWRHLCAALLIRT